MKIPCPRRRNITPASASAISRPPRVSDEGYENSTEQFGIFVDPPRSSVGPRQESLKREPPLHIRRVLRGT